MIIQKTTKEILAESIQELAAKKSVDKITIKEITQNCGLTPTTFYNHFSDKYELLACIYNVSIESFFGRLGKDVSWRDCLYQSAFILTKNKPFYKNALENTQGQVSFRYATNNFAIDLVIERIRRNFGFTEIPADIRFFVVFYMRALSEAINDWFLEGMKIPLDEFADLLLKSMPPPLEPYLK
ncbi:MAG: TetR/AcrR family transcriptional regulator C-terminal domain-containing protein [Selenomonadaceae bacterium]|nr:TetR/AcrR family transcriptional regulator C-terminal domain-containing protein [Selenomonadaceae bacterium]